MVLVVGGDDMSDSGGEGMVDFSSSIAVGIVTVELEERDVK